MLKLTEEWKRRGVDSPHELSILAETLTKSVFDGKSEANSNDLTRILAAFREEVARQLTIKEDAQGFNETHEVAQLGGSIAGDARLNYEQKTGLKVVSAVNFLEEKALKEKEEE